YDWVKYYAYTPGTGDNFTLQWTDDFNSFDVTRWQKATHTWDGNNAQFVTDNAVLANGYLILCLTSNTTSGYGGGPVVDQDVDAPSLVWARAYDSTIVVRFSETVDQLSAETISHYFGGAAAYKSAKLRPDGRTVDVSVSGMDLATPFILFVQGIKDTAASANTMSLSHVRVTMPLSFPIKIDVGGTGDANYRADSAWAETNDYGYIGGSPFAVLPSNPVSGTTEPAIYRTVVHGISGYKVRVPNGTYNVTLKMMEDRFASAGKRVFSAKVEGQTLFTNLDLFQQAGLLKAYDVVASSVVVEDNIVDIWLGAQTDSTTLAGIVIDRLAGPTGVRDQPGFPTNYEFSVFPNPFNGATVLHFALPVAGQISMLIHDTLGRVVQSMDLGMISAGVHEFRWADEKLSSGIYFFTLRGFEHQSTVRCVIMK
ncbi:MAG: malectin domain-containing carbohydrate-binding protein, partial [Bacteroidota bacterium]